jgi:hypothetical protein
VISLTSPAQNSVTRNATVTLQGRIDEAGTLTINGQAVSLAADLTFSSGPRALSSGANLFDFVAKDAAGNTSTLRAQVVLDSVAPKLFFATPAANSTVRSNRPALELNHFDAAALDRSSLVIKKAGVAVAVACVTDAAKSICTPTSALGTGPTTLTATIADTAGNVSTPASVTFTIDPNFGAAPTTVIGDVRYVGGSAAPGAQVRVAGVGSVTTTTGPDGRFSIPGVEASLPLTVVARTTGAGGALTGGKTGVAPVAGGATDVGTLTLRPPCPLR